MAKKTEAHASTEVSLKKYELMFILQPNLLESAVEKKLKEFEKFLAENDGQVDLKDVLGKKTLAYRIGKNEEGIYVVYNLSLPGSFNAELDEYLRIEKDVIRFLLISLPDGYEYQKYDEIALVKPAQIAAERKTERKVGEASHKAEGQAAEDTKDKGKKADSKSLDEKLGKILEGNDLAV